MGKILTLDDLNKIERFHKDQVSEGTEADKPLVLDSHTHTQGIGFMFTKNGILQGLETHDDAATLENRVRVLNKNKEEIHPNKIGAFFLLYWNSLDNHIDPVWLQRIKQLFDPYEAQRTVGLKERVEQNLPRWMQQDGIAFLPGFEFTYVVGNKYYHLTAVFNETDVFVDKRLRKMLQKVTDAENDRFFRVYKRIVDEYNISITDADEVLKELAIGLKTPLGMGTLGILLARLDEMIVSGSSDASKVFEKYQIYEHWKKELHNFRYDENFLKYLVEKHGAFISVVHPGRFVLEEMIDLKTETLPNDMSDNDFKFTLREKYREFIGALPLKYIHAVEANYPYGRNPRIRRIIGNNYSYYQQLCCIASEVADENGLLITGGSDFISFADNGYTMDTSREPMD